MGKKEAERPKTDQSVEEKAWGDLYVHKYQIGGCKEDKEQKGQEDISTNWNRENCIST